MCRGARGPPAARRPVTRYGECFMTRGLHRRIALWMLLGLLLQLSGVLQLLAANGSVRGRLTVEGGTPPPGAVVRATPLDGGPASTAALGADLGYQFPQLKEGAYLFELVSPDGRPLGAGTLLQWDMLSDAAA